MPPKKRANADTLTGGSGDVNPQYLHGQVVQTGVDTTTTTSFTLPVTRLPQGGKVTIIEVLKIFVNMNTANLVGTNVAETNYNLQIAFTTISFNATAAAFNEPNMFALLQTEKRGAFTAAGSYFISDNGILQYDLTDGAGHGILLATDQIFGQVASANTGVANTVAFKILYRFKTVALEEYVGIVQSQQ